MTKKRIKTLLLFTAFAICAMVAPQTAFAAEQTTIEVSTSSEFNDAVKTANAATSGEYTICLKNDIEGGGTSFNSTRPITILGNGHTITLGQYSSLSVQPGSQLNLGAEDGSDTLMISGGNKQGNDVPGLLYIQGSCNMHPGVTIADRKGNNYFGGGVTVQGGEFHMYGGTINNCGITGGSMCYDGGVAVIYGGSFIMDGGEITNCFATSPFKAADYVDYGFDPRTVTSVGGGVCVIGGSTFIMNGGTISGNTANEMGGGIAVVASIEEIGNGKWGNLESSVQILGGTICGNHANDGAGVFASAYFFTAAYAICADTPSVTAAEKPGLFVENATISNNTANKDEGYGAGVLAVMLASPAKAEISSCTITGNSGAVGGGVMSYGNYTSLTIDNCVITDNHATNYGGGFAAESNSGQNAGTVITNTQLCNNTANKAASDVYVDDSSLKLQSAQDMNSLYQGKPDDVTGKKIDGWYTDDENLRYTEQTKEQRSEFTGYTNIAASGKTCLIAAANPDVDNPNKPDKGDGSGTDNPGDNKPDKDNQKPAGADTDQKPGNSDKEPGNKNDDQPNKDNADNNNGGKNATNNGDAPNAENVIPATGDAASTFVIASLLIACCALAVAVIAKRKQSNL